MAAVLAGAVTVTCFHGGLLEISPGSGKLAVGGDGVLLRGDLIGKTITNCPGNPKCGAITTVDTGLASRLRVGSDPVVLAGANGKTATATWRITTPGRNELETT